MSAKQKTTAEDLRAAIARSGVPTYVIGGRARINPVRMSRLLRGHAQITDEVVVRILSAVQEETANDGR